MQTLTLSEIAVQEILNALDISTDKWMEGMPKTTAKPFSNDVRNQILDQMKK